MSKGLTVAGLVLAAILLASACAQPPGEGDDAPYGSQPAVVERIVDGDTIVVDLEDSTDPSISSAGQEIQLLEMDAPEAQTPDGPAECWGPEATRFAEGVLPVGSTVHVMPEEQDTDGRLAGYVWTESGVLYSELAVREGQARATPEVFVQRLGAAEAEAQAANRGMWGPPCDYGTSAPTTGVSTPGTPTP